MKSRSFLHGYRGSPQIALLFLLTYAFLLRLYQLSQKSFWLDEIFSLLRSTPRSFSSFLQEMQHSCHPPLYFLTLSYWKFLDKLYPYSSFLSEESHTRLLSVCCSTLALVFFYHIGRYWFKPKELLLPLLLCATSPLYVFYAQEARQYSMVLLLVLATQWAFLHAQFIILSPETSSSPLRGKIFYTLFLILGLYCFTYTIWVPLSHCFFLLFEHYWNGKKVQWKALLLCWILGACAYLPWLPFLWNRVHYIQEALHESQYSGVAFIYGNHVLSQEFTRIFTGILPLWNGLGYLFFALGLVIGYCYRFSFFLFQLYLPFVFLLLLPVQAHHFEIKHLLFATPFYFLLLTPLLNQRRGYYFVAFLLILEVVALWHYFQPSFQKEDWRSIVAFTLPLKDPNTAILVDPPQCLYPFLHYVPPIAKQGIYAYQGEKDPQCPFWKTFYRRILWIRVQNSVSAPLGIPSFLHQDYHYTALLESQGYSGTITLFLWVRK
jgi:uncharacterized membrane protein